MGSVRQGTGLAPQQVSRAQHQLLTPQEALGTSAKSGCRGRRQSRVCLQEEDMQQMLDSLVAYQPGHMGPAASWPTVTHCPAESQPIKHGPLATGRRNGEHTFSPNYNPSTKLKAWLRLLPAAPGPPTAPGSKVSSRAWPPAPTFQGPQDSAESTQMQQHSKSLGFTLTHLSSTEGGQSSDLSRDKMGPGAAWVRAGTKRPTETHRCTDAATQSRHRHAL